MMMMMMLLLLLLLAAAGVEKEAQMSRRIAHKR
jgi:hypothetical protein